MQLEDQVCTLEQGRKLANLGISSTGSYFRYFEDNSKTYVADMLHDSLSDDDDITEIAPAYNASEIILMLPKIYIAKFMKEDTWIYAVQYLHNDNILQTYSFEADRLVKALCNLFIMLLERGILNYLDCNKSLLEY